MAITKAEARRRLRVPIIIVVLVLAAHIWDDYSRNGHITGAIVFATLTMIVLVTIIFGVISWLLTKPKA